MHSIVTEKIREIDLLQENEDRFNYRHLAKHLLDYILNKEFPISIGVYGKWGSGKSVLVNYLKIAAKKQNISVSIFDPFDFISGKNISDDIIEKIIEKNNIRFILYILIILFLIFLNISLTLSFFLYLLPIALFINFLREIFSFSVLYRIISKIIKNKSFKNGFIESSVLKRQIIVIDNLDRLPPKETILFLEKMKAILLRKNSLWSKKFSYIIPCDFNILKKEVRNIYSNEDIDVRDYLNKLIEVSFLMPSYRSELTNGFVDMLLNKDIIPEVRKRITNIFEHSDLFDTPRDIKNFLMELDMIFIIAKARNKWSESYLLENLDKILAVHILRSTFKELYSFSVIEAKAGSLLFIRGHSAFTRFLYSPNSDPNDTFKYKNHRDKYQKLKNLFTDIVKMITSDSNGDIMREEIFNFLKIVEIVDSSTQTSKLELTESIGINPIGV